MGVNTNAYRLPVLSRIDLEELLLKYKALNGLAPNYFTELIAPNAHRDPLIAP